jgi:membrane protein DedA with SNARE-associated domain
LEFIDKFMKKTFLFLALIANTLGWAQDSLHVNTDTLIAVENIEVSSSLSLVERVESWYADHMNYATITALMAIESSFIPFPSEVVVPPAAYVAGIEGSTLHTTDSYPLNVLLVVLFGTLGAILGAIINYLLAMWLGRPIIYAFADSKIGHLCMLSKEKVKQAEEYFNAHGNASTFVGRLIPGIRQLISIPAGLCKMHFGWFLFYTFLGAGIWNVVLALLGYIAHGQMDLIHTYSHELSIAIMALFAIIIVYFIGKTIVKKIRSSK